MKKWNLDNSIIVAEELNFSRAANRLNITQPPLSMQIQKLEEELEITLFFRNNRRVELSEAGRAFYEDAVKIVEDIKSSIDHAKLVHQGMNRHLRVGFVGSATYDILPSVLREFRSQHPDVQVHLSELSTPAQIEALQKNEIDIGVLRPPVMEESIRTEIVSIAPCVLAVPKGHPLLANG